MRFPRSTERQRVLQGVRASKPSSDRSLVSKQSEGEGEKKQSRSEYADAQVKGGGTETNTSALRLPQVTQRGFKPGSTGQRILTNE